MPACNGRRCAGGGLDLFFLSGSVTDIRQNVGGELGGVLRKTTPPNSNPTQLDRSLRFVRYLLLSNHIVYLNFLQSNSQSFIE